MTEAADTPMSAVVQLLHRQLDAARVIIAGLDQRAIEHGKERAKLMSQAADVAGERAANAALTAELAASAELLRLVRVERDDLAGQLAAERERCDTLARAALDAATEGEWAKAAVLLQRISGPNVRANLDPTARGPHE